MVFNDTKVINARLFGEKAKWAWDITVPCHRAAP
jgi:S-adenosylmethionine:tRNA-ribosyltransferase-isomerase (queuine synthetase)